MPADTPAKVANRARLRSNAYQRTLAARARVTNGKELLPNIGGRSQPARRWRDLYRLYVNRTGGRHDELCQTAASLSLRLEIETAAVIRGEEVDPDVTVRLAGAIGRVLDRLEKATATPVPDDPVSTPAALEPEPRTTFRDPAPHVSFLGNPRPNPVPAPRAAPVKVGVFAARRGYLVRARIRSAREWREDS